MTDPPGVIDRSSSEPFHYQLCKLLEQHIQTGQWLQGDLYGFSLLDASRTVRGGSRRQQRIL